MKMKSRAQRSRAFRSEGPNWVFIAGSALLSTLSIRLGYKLRQVLDAKEQNSADENAVKGNENCHSSISGGATVKQHCNDSELRDPEIVLPLAIVPTPEFCKESDRSWLSSSDRVSESGSDVYNKREVIQKLRQQLKKRDETILAMQDQVLELQSSLNAQLLHSANLQSLLDVANREPLESERETQRLRKIVTEHFVGNGLANSHRDIERHSRSLESLKDEVDSQLLNIF